MDQSLFPCILLGKPNEIAMYDPDTQKDRRVDGKHFSKQDLGCVRTSNWDDNDLSFILF